MAKKRPFYLILMGVVLAAAIGLRLADPAPVAGLRLAVFDSYLAASPRIADPALPVRIVDIDEASLAALGQWPWPRTKLAELLDQLGKLGARSVSIDLILAEPDRLSPSVLLDQWKDRPELEGLAGRLTALPSHDAELAKAMTNVAVVLGFSAENGPSHQLAPPRAPFALAGDDAKLFAPAFPGGTGSLPALADAATGLGAVNWLPERDQVVRRVPLILNVGGTLYPSLALETLRIASDSRTTVFIKSSGASGLMAFGQQTGIELVRVGSTILPSDNQGELWLKFARPDPARYISAHDVIGKRVDRSLIEGRHIFIGASATGLMDRRATPLQPSVPGVEIHAQALEQMLQGDHLVRPAWATGAEIIFLAAACALAAWLIGWAGAAWAAAAAAAAIATIAGVSIIAYSGAGLLFDPVYPALSLVGVYLAGSLSNYMRAERDRARIRSAFGHYVAPAVVDELARSEGALKLGGETREITLLFADVRGFSRLSEGMDAEHLVRFVNALFTPLADVILEKRGTIDKFMGDAVMAFWNAPLAEPDHAMSACRAALAMQDAITQFNLTERKAAQPVRIGIGLNTGPCVVGNVGSPQRFDYSVLGDVVNTAARLEEATKIYGAPIIVGEATARSAASLALVAIGEASLRGKDRPEKLYALMGDETLAASDEFQTFQAAFNALTEAMRSGTPDAIHPAREACYTAAISRAIPGARDLVEAALQRST